MRAFKQGMAPIVIALLVSTSFLLGAAGGNLQRDWPLWLLALASGLIIRRTRIHLLWVLAAGALAGALQLV